MIDYMLAPEEYLKLTEMNILLLTELYKIGSNSLFRVSFLWCISIELQ